LLDTKEEKGIRFDDGKVRHDLLSSNAINELSKVLTFGAQKYAAHNWRKGMAWSRVIGSLKRHLNAIERGEDFDHETGVLHAAHVMCNAMFLTDYYKIYPEGDDRPHEYLTYKRIGLDIDEVLCDFTQGWGDLYNSNPRPNSWYFDRQMLEKFKELEEKGELESFYLNLKPKTLAKDLPFEPHCYVTSRPVPTAVTEKWLDMHGFPTRKVITVDINTSKVDVLKQENVDIFVDDRYENFVELNKAGICTFLFDAAHNHKYEVGYKRIKSLKELV